MSDNVSQCVDLGAWLGRGQAFGAVANQCSAVQADCLRNIRESSSYAALGLTWEEFCKDYVGLTRQRVDAIIQNLEEFGDTYFRLKEIVRISPAHYRQFADTIADGAIQIDGEAVPIGAENAARIRAAVLAARARFRAAAPAVPPVDHLRARFDGLLKHAARLIAGTPPPERAALKTFVDYAADRCGSLSREFPNDPTPPC